MLGSIEAEGWVSMCELFIDASHLPIHCWQGRDESFTSNVRAVKVDLRRLI